jgi:hypothetical protein
MNGCGSAVVTSFRQLDFCLNHFVSRCYEDLDRLDPRGRAGVGSAERSALKAFVEECSRRALEVSLSCQKMNNLHRGQLLDILLWAGEMIPREPGERTKLQTYRAANPREAESREFSR